MDFVFPVKSLSEQPVPQHVYRFLDFVFSALLLLTLSLLSF